ncbi:hypothetical protein H4V97_000994 [Flavobacterium sp. CG_23.5]|uniref:hypothetical protein n=1 Tax=unclassified Flavobacterium TaxID=196869 RepID=UPI0018CA2B87|nr:MULTISPECIES: hypothetical protein [unclassified Flavobacterium]MBG6111481.1 hypothetical protein [Flavobacterium sp. CG_9.10]MBP2282676.1 hypothetical protein [Flavobacterium sp. CG_23.5]
MPLDYYHTLEYLKQAKAYSEKGIINFRLDQYSNNHMEIVTLIFASCKLIEPRNGNFKNQKI